MITNKANTSLLKELSEHIDWDPSEEGLTPHVDINSSKMLHTFKRHFMTEGVEDKFTSGSKDTLYNVLKAHPPMSLLLYAGGILTLDNILSLTNEGKQENKMFPFPFKFFDDDPEGMKCFNATRDVCTIINGLRKLDEFDDTGRTVAPVSSPEAINAVNKVLNEMTTLPDINTIVDKALSGQKFSDKADAIQREFDKFTKQVAKERVETQKALADYAILKEMGPATAEVEASHDGTIPSGKYTMESASKVFGINMKQDLQVPVWEWDGVHPNVPSVDENYIFRVEELTRVLFAITTNQRAYLHGHTGSGKTTLIEQVCAFLKYPFVRVNFDSEITRMDLIGRDTLTTGDDGNVISEFSDGMLPRAMSGPCIMCCDEIDFVRPDVAYVMQAALEGNGLRITEDGDRLVKPDPMFRMFATGNTVGQGDEFGMYQGARPQSLALLDRFTVWAKINYLDETQRADLVRKHYPSLTEQQYKVINSYTSEHLAAFLEGEVIQPISPRGMLAIAKATAILGDVKQSLNMTVLDRANAEDHATLLGLVDRVA